MYNMLSDIELVPSSHIMIGVKTTDFGPAVDTRDCNGVLFILSGNSEGMDCGTSGTLRAYSSTDAAGTFVRYGSSSIVYTTNPVGIKNMRVLDVYKPKRPYIKAAWSGTTGDVFLVCMKYGMRKAGSTSVHDQATVNAALLTTT